VITPPSAASVLKAEVVDSFAELGVSAFTTGRSAGTFATQSHEPIRDVMGRWSELRARLGGARLATAAQVHGAEVLEHELGWTGWLRADSADGHLARVRGTAMAVTVADCVPVFIAHPSGATAILHSGWRGTAAHITERAIGRLATIGLAPDELRVHCGPAICGRCYEVSADVALQLTRRDPGRSVHVDLRELITQQVRELGVRHVSSSSYCTRCDNDRFFSHRAGDSGRQLGVILAHA
jgi:purine-nucleoside/S-methyl-5'-thioadenosine phosphorylase / adenosine deaminase